MWNLVGKFHNFPQGLMKINKNIFYFKILEINKLKKRNKEKIFLVQFWYQCLT